jgi:antitoxin ParD1/3/4
MQQDEVYQMKLKALRSAVAAGLESGQAADFNVASIIAEAKGRAGIDA